MLFNHDIVLQIKLICEDATSLDISRAEVASEIDEQVSAVIVVYRSTHDSTCMAFSPALVGLAIHQAPSEAQFIVDLYLNQFTLWTGVRNGVGMQD